MIILFTRKKYFPLLNLRKIRQLIKTIPVILIISVFCMCSPAKQDPLIRTTKYGTIRGKQVENVYVFLGIPYAKPPVGDLRWRSPQEPEPWTGVKEALGYPKPCPPYIRSKNDIGKGSEDCLYLNVITPVEPEASTLPVLVFFHGGSNAWSSPTGATIGIENLLVGRKSNIVLVTVQYRLNLLGFLSHPALSKENPHNSSGNYGQLDQIASLKWVRDNIERFGGDPDRVTISGSSGGSIDIGIHLTSPLSKGLFHRAIMQSWPLAAPSMERKLKQGLAFAELAGCGEGPEAADCLRKLPLAQVMKLQSEIPRGATAGFYQGIDGWGLLEFPLKVIQEKKHNKVPFMIGAQAEDQSTHARKRFASLTTDKEFKDAVKKFLHYIPQAKISHYVDRLEKLYPLKDFQNQEWRFIELYNDCIQTCPNRRIAKITAASQTEPVYWYSMTHRLSGDYAKYGAHHAILNYFLFQGIRKGRLPPWWPRKTKYIPTEDDLKVADYIADYWTSFASDGTMENVSAAPWPPVMPDSVTVLLIGSPSRSVLGYKEEQCACWDEISGMRKFD